MKQKKINIIFVIPNLRAGGAERVVSFLAKELDKTKFNTTLIVIGYKKDIAYNVENLNVVCFEKSRVLTGIPKIFNYLHIDKPDIVFSVVGHLNTVMAYISIFFPRIKFVAREVNVLSVLNNFNDQKFFNFSFLIKRRFNFFDKIICQSKDMFNDLNEHFKIDQNKLVIINNPITKAFKVKLKEIKQDELNFITVARFKKQKGHERIIKTLNKLNIPFHYTIIGDGPEKDNIFNLIDRLGIKERITHVPFSNEVEKYLGKSDIYLQGSYVEGFPNALIESCAVGTPVVAFKAPGGLNEIIIDGLNGFIVNNENEFIESIQTLYNNPLEPKTVSESVYRKYSFEKILKKYEDLLTSIIQN